MKKELLWILMLILSIQNSYGQKHLPEELTASPVFIQHSKGTGTGFFLRDSLNMYFVTARHNVFDLKSGKALVDSMTITSYHNDPTTDQENVLKLYVDKAVSNELLHSKNTDDALIVKVAKLNYLSNEKAGVNYYECIKKMTPSAYLNALPIDALIKYDSIYVGDEIFLFGYPTSIGLKQSPQFEYSRPLIRKGVVAGKNNKIKTIVLDCPSYPGNSGGPVIRKITDGLMWEYGLIGLVIQFIPYEEQWINLKSGLVSTDRFNSGYSIAISSDKIIELINDAK